MYLFLVIVTKIIQTFEIDKNIFFCVWILKIGLVWTRKSHVIYIEDKAIGLPTYLLGLLPPKSKLFSDQTLNPDMDDNDIFFPKIFFGWIA